MINMITKKKVMIIITIILTVTMFSTQVCAQEKEQNENANTKNNEEEVTEIDNIKELDAELDVVSSEIEAEEILNSCESSVVNEFLEDIYLDIEDEISDTKSTSQVEQKLVALEKEEVAIDSITFDENHYEKNDKSELEYDIVAVNNDSLKITLTDELEDDIFAEALSGTIVYKEYGNRRYTAKSTFKQYKVLPITVINRIGYTIKSNETLSKRYISVAKLNKNEVFQKKIYYASCNNAYMDYWKKGTNTSKMPYIKSVGHYSYKIYQKNSDGDWKYKEAVRKTLRAYATVSKWKKKGADMNQHCTLVSGYKS